MRLYLLDAYNLLFRSFCSLPATVVDGSGLPINAVYGTIAFLLRLQREEGATHMFAAFDTPTVPTFRHGLYPAYQAQRGPLGGDQANDFLRQVESARLILPALGIPQLAMPGYEADDIMGTLARCARESGSGATIVSTDRDILQLVGGGIDVVVPGTRLTFVGDDAAIRAKLGVPAEGVTTFKALSGDSSDNIPGVRGIGTKTAARLVDEYGDLESIYRHLDAITPRVRALLLEGKERAFLFLRLVTIVTDLRLPLRVMDIPEVQFEANTKVRALLDAAAQ